jgi:hypothetical protein
VCIDAFVFEAKIDSVSRMDGGIALLLVVNGYFRKRSGYCTLSSVDPRPLDDGACMVDALFPKHFFSTNVLVGDVSWRHSSY